jgi:DNA helicase-2/ATP-dependent DNA helicase PcrA
LGKVWLSEIKRLADQNNTTLIEAVENNPLNKQSAIEFVNLIIEFRKWKDEVSVSYLVKEILDKTGLTEMYRRDGDEERLDNIIELQNSIITLENNDVEKLTLENYLQEIALYTDMDVNDKKNDRVKLMTIHTAKGLEFPYVFLCGFTDGILPSYKSMKERRLEEERRLTYVAITRAEKAFYITESEGLNFQNGMYKYPSRFLWEIKENLYVRKGVLSQTIIDLAKKRLELEEESSDPQSIPVLEVGDVVEFYTWGEGKVISKDDEQKVYMVNFSKLNGVRPIRYDWRGIKKIVENNITIVNEPLFAKCSVITENESINNIENIFTCNKNDIETQLKDKNFLSKCKRIFKKIIKFQTFKS